MRRILLLTLPALALLSACGKEAAPPTPGVEPDDAAEAPRDGCFPGDNVTAFTVSGERDGKPETFGSRETGAVTVYGVMSATCPYALAYAPKLDAIEEAYAPKGVKFVWLYPVNDEKEPETAKRAWHAAQKLGGTFVVDRSGAISKLWSAELTPSVYVVDAKGTVRYTGAVDDGAGHPEEAKTEILRLAIDAALAGRAPAVTQLPPEGG